MELNNMFREVNDDIQILQWGENITLQNVEHFRQMMEQLINHESECLILNLAGMNYINSAGLGIIVDAVMTARKNMKELILCDISQSVKEIFVIVKFSAIMKMVDSEEMAIEYFSGS